MGKKRAVEFRFSPSGRLHAVFAMPFVIQMAMSTMGRADSSAVGIRADNQAIQITISNPPALG